ncbi:hypothetical protein BH09BAC1_BH09BAC1_31050 [soil metagenome]
MVFALVHACSLNNEILRPSCEVFEVEMVDKWWAAQGTYKSDNKIMFKSDGQLMETDAAHGWMHKNAADSVSYSLTNCNKLVVTNHTSGDIEEMEVFDLMPDVMILQVSDKEQITFKKQ